MIELWGNEYPKMQILTIGEILEGFRFATPTVAGRHTPNPQNTRTPRIEAVSPYLLIAYYYEGGTDRRFLAPIGDREAAGSSHPGTPATARTVTRRQPEAEFARRGAAWEDPPHSTEKGASFQAQIHQRYSSALTSPQTHLDTAALPSGQTQRFDNDSHGIAQLVRHLAGLQPEGIVLEATGSLELPLATQLALAGLGCGHRQPAQVRDFAKALGRLAKTDAIDALVLETRTETPCCEGVMWQ